MAQRPLFDDTSLEAERVLIECTRALGPTGRLARVAALREATLGTATLRLQKQHPDWSARRVRIELARAWLPADIHRRAFGAQHQ